ncbi:MAG: mechanosensitive ion channel family protein [Acidobacteriota bacterium]|nr:mechanosensitive ion channel family protein [Acidobacteriota bacterium]
MRIFGIQLVGVNAATGNKLLLTIAFGIAIWTLSHILRAIARALLRNRDDVRAHFWSRQAVQLLATVLFLLMLVSIWFDQPQRVAGPAGLITAGLAVALQRVITAVAAYFVILRGRVFNVGDRIAMAGVRGDVIALGYTRTTIMEMGQTPQEQSDDPSMWVDARQFTGRIVTVTNDKIFDEPVYNYSRDFPYIWEEIHVPIQHGADYWKAEQILLEATGRHTPDLKQINARDVATLRRRYGITPEHAVPRVYLRITDNWLEMTVRFLVPDHGIRGVKDAIAREVIEQFAAAGITVASTTVAVVQVAPIRVEGE